MEKRHFERFVYGLVLADRDSSRLYMNMRARELLVPTDRGQNGTRWTCCDLICGRLGPVLDRGCLAEQTTTTEGPLPEVRMDVDGHHSRAAAWVTASRIDTEGAQLLFHLRPAGRNDRRRQSHSEYRVRVDSDEFEREARAGLTAFVQGLKEPATRHLDNALRLYRAPFLSEDPYEEWALDGSDCTSMDAQRTILDLCIRRAPVV